MGSTHAPPQFTCVPGHDTEHVPAAHTSPAPHALPHLPQFAPSLDKAAQNAAPPSAPLQSVVLPPHVVPQLPAEHAVPLGHAWPQLPQLPLSLRGSTHAPPQDSSPVGHAPSAPPSVDGSWPLAQQVFVDAQW